MLIASAPAALVIGAAFAVLKVPTCCSGRRRRQPGRRLGVGRPGRPGRGAGRDNEGPQPCRAGNQTPDRPAHLRGRRRFQLAGTPRCWLARSRDGRWPNRRSSTPGHAQQHGRHPPRSRKRSPRCWNITLLPCSAEGRPVILPTRRCLTLRSRPTGRTAGVAASAAASCRRRPTTARRQPGRLPMPRRCGDERVLHVGPVPVPAVGSLPGGPPWLCGPGQGALPRPRPGAGRLGGGARLAVPLGRERRPCDRVGPVPGRAGASGDPLGADASPSA